MASIAKTTRVLNEYITDEKLVGEIGGGGDIVNVIQRMDELLDHDTKYRVLDACACCTKTSKARDKQCKEYGKTMADKPLEEKVKGLGGINFGGITLNDDKTLTVSFCWIIDGKRYCSCGAVDVPIIASKLLLQKKNLAVDDRVMPLSYCYCCAGHFRYHLQNALQVKLKTKEIVSSPINSKGERPCEFIFEIE